MTKLNVHFHKRRLTEDQDLFVREGDFIAYGEAYYEIVTLKEPKELFGQADKRIEISAECIRARRVLLMAHKGSINEEETSRDVARFKSDLEDIDFAVYKFVDEVINAQTKTNKGFKKTPVIWSGSERRIT